MQTVLENSKATFSGWISPYVQLLYRFGSDYYARLASMPSGGRKISENENGEEETIVATAPFWPSDEFTEEADSIEESYSAVPVQVVSEEDHVETEKIEPKFNLERKPDVTDSSDVDATPSEITSDSDMSYINYYDVENATVYRKSSIDDKPKINGVLYKQKDEATIEKEARPEAPKTESSIEIISLNTESVSSKGDNQEANNKVQSADSLSSESELIRPTYQKTTKEIKVPQKSNISKKIDVSLAQTRARRLSQSELLNETPPTTPIVLSKKSDNTLIRKIYADPSVRSFALSKRDAIPVIYPDKQSNLQSGAKYKSTSALNSDVETFAKPASSDAQSRRPLQRSASATPLREAYVEVFDAIQRPVSQASHRMSENETFSLESSENNKSESQKSTTTETDPEIKQLKEKKLVASILGEFSKSYPNVSKIHSHRLHKDRFVNREVLKSLDHHGYKSSDEESHISVKDLKKRFESSDAVSKTDKPIYSLTARSLSKQVRDDLKNQNMDEPPSIEVIKRDAA